MKLKIVAYAMLALALILNLARSSFEAALGGMLCGEDYLQPVKGALKEESCGFNLDGYIGTVSLICFAAAVTILSLNIVLSIVRRANS